MAERVTVTYQTTPEIKARLDRVAKSMDRSKSFLSNVAVELYLSEEESFLTDVEAGIDDLEAGRTVTTAELKQSLTDHISNVNTGTMSA